MEDVTELEQVFERVIRLGEPVRCRVIAGAVERTFHDARERLVAHAAHPARLPLVGLEQVLALAAASRLDRGAAAALTLEHARAHVARALVSSRIDESWRLLEEAREAARHAPGALVDWMVGGRDAVSREAPRGALAEA